MNRNNVIGKGSQANLDTTLPIMQQLVAKAFEISNQRKLHCPDFSITDALRTAVEQRELFKIGRIYLCGEWEKTGELIVTNCDGEDIVSVHQSGLAIDFCAWVDGKANYEPSNLALVVTAFYEAAFELGIEIDWGGNFKSISDGCHIEIVKYNKGT